MHSVWVAHLPKVSLPIGKQQFADLHALEPKLARLNRAEKVDDGPTAYLSCLRWANYQLPPQLCPPDSPIQLRPCAHGALRRSYMHSKCRVELLAYFTYQRV